MSVIDVVEGRYIDMRERFLFFNGKVHLTLHLPNCFLPLNLNFHIAIFEQGLAISHEHNYRTLI